MWSSPTGHRSGLPVRESGPLIHRAALVTRETRRNTEPADTRTQNGPASMPGRAVGELVLLLRSRSGGRAGCAFRCPLRGRSLALLHLLFRRLLHLLLCRRVLRGIRGFHLVALRKRRGCDQQGGGRGNQWFQHWPLLRVVGRNATS